MKKSSIICKNKLRKFFLTQLKRENYTKMEIRQFKGSQIEPYIHELAKLRIEIFREYPYLYDGTMEYEKSYLATYLNSNESVFVLAFDKEKIVGASTAIPLQDEMEEIKQAYFKANYPIEKTFYCGESLLLPDYRGKGIYKDFFKAREIAARIWGAKNTTFLAINREENHSQKPSNYQNLNKIWYHFGYQPQQNIIAYLTWKQIDEKQESKKALMAWVKEL